jgi:hypothetical protein
MKKGKKESNINSRPAQIHEIHKNSLLCSLTKNLRRPHHSSSPITSKLRIVFTQNVENSAKKLPMTQQKEENSLLPKNVYNKK